MFNLNFLVNILFISPAYLYSISLNDSQLSLNKSDLKNYWNFSSSWNNQEVLRDSIEEYGKFLQLSLNDFIIQEEDEEEDFLKDYLNKNMESFSSHLLKIKEVLNNMSNITFETVRLELRNLRTTPNIDIFRDESSNETSITFCGLNEQVLNTISSLYLLDIFQNMKDEIRSLFHYESKSLNVISSRNSFLRSFMELYRLACSPEMNKTLIENKMKLLDIKLQDTHDYFKCWGRKQFLADTESDYGLENYLQRRTSQLGCSKPEILENELNEKFSFWTWNVTDQLDDYDTEVKFKNEKSFSQGNLFVQNDDSCFYVISYVDNETKDKSPESLVCNYNAVRNLAKQFRLETNLQVEEEDQDEEEFEYGDPDMEDFVDELDLDPEDHNLNKDLNNDELEY